MAVLPPDPVFLLKGDMGLVHSLSYCDYEKGYTATLLASTESGFVYLWDLESNRVKYKQKMGESIQAVHSIDHTIVTQEKSGLIKNWTVKESKYEVDATYESPGGFCKSLVFDNFLIVPEANSKIAVLDLNFKRVYTLTSEEENLGMPVSLEKVVIKETNYILVGYESGDLILFDINATKQCGKLCLKGPITSITFDPVSRRGIAGNPTNALQLFTIDQSLNITLKCEVSLTNEGCGVVKGRPDGKIFVCGCWDGRIRIFSGKTLRVLVVLTEHKKSITDIQFSPNPVNYWKKNIMAASSLDGTISLWNIYN